MIRKTGLIRSTTLAIATAIFVIPVANSGGKLPTLVQRGGPVSSQPLAKQPQHDRFIIHYRDGGRKATAAATRQRLTQAAQVLGIGIQPMRTLATGGTLIHLDRKLDKTAGKRLTLELMKDPNVLAVEPDRLLQPAFVPNDPGYPLQWHYKNGPGGINLEPAWDIARGAGIVVAVLDTGITPHSDLAANLVPGYDFIFDPAVSVDGDGRDPDPNDPGDGNCGGGGGGSSWHGTHVSGTVAAVTDNGVGVAGVAFEAKVQPVRVLGRCGGYVSDITDAIVWASGGAVDGVPANATPAEVINLSLGGFGACSIAEQIAVNSAVSRGTTVVVAAGNSARDVADFSPANCDNVIAVSAVGPAGRLAAYSNFGTGVNVAAPGGTGLTPAADNVLSTFNLGTQEQGAEGYAWYAGTSMAAPHVAGTVALMQSVAPTPYTPAEVETILENTVTGYPLGCDLDDKPCGSGIIDARYAVAVASGAEPLPPDPPPPPPPTTIELENGVTVTGIEVLANESIIYRLEVPKGASQLLFGMYGGTGDADLSVRYAAPPTDSAYDCRPFLFGNNENCYFPVPESGLWYVRIKGFFVASGVSLYPRFLGGNEEAPSDLAARHVFALKKHRTRVALSWEGGTGQEVDIYFNDVATTAANTGRFTHTFALQGTGTVTYKVCNAGTDECSADLEVNYTSRP